MKKVLVISYYWPPNAGSSVQRTLKFVKYLPAYGWRPVVLVPRNPFLGKIEIDETLLEDVPDELKVFECRSLEVDRGVSRVVSAISGIAACLGKLAGNEGMGGALQWRLDVAYNRIKKIFVPDHKAGWVPGAVWAGLNIIRRENIAAIYSTSPYPTCHLIGYILARMTRKPWISDYRDPWTQQIMDPVGGLPNKVNEWMEKRFLKRASAIVTVNNEIREGFLSKYPGIDRNKLYVIENGYDEDDFPKIIEDRRHLFRMVYAGRFYKITRSPVAFLQALRGCINKYNEVQGQLEVEFIGNVQKEFLEQITELELDKVVINVGYIAHKKSCKRLLESDCLLLIQANVRGSEYIMTGKIYEYLYARKPILAVVPEGAAAWLIRRTGAGEVVDPDDIPAIQEAIYRMYTKYGVRKAVFNPVNDEIVQYSRRNLTKRLAELLEKSTLNNGKLECGHEDRLVS